MKECSDLILPWQQNLPEGKLPMMQTDENDESELLKIRKNNVLLIDDSLRAITSLNQIFSNLGCDTILSFDGYTAINSLMQNEVDLIVLDMRMPQMDGDETLARADEMMSQLREQEKLNLMPESKNIPVVIYSGLENIEISKDVAKHFEIVDVWHKPMSYSALSVRASLLVDNMGAA